MHWPSLTRLRIDCCSEGALTTCFQLAVSSDADTNQVTECTQLDADLPDRHLFEWSFRFHVAFHFPPVRNEIGLFCRKGIRSYRAVHRY